MLDENHFRFLPIYGSYNHYGYTNKDLIVSFINFIPEIIGNIEIKIEMEDLDIDKYKDENQINEEKDEDENQINEEDGDKIIEGEEKEKEIVGEEDKKYLENKIKNLTNISLPFSIVVKFIASLHEFIIHLIYVYN